MKIKVENLRGISNSQLEFDKNAYISQTNGYGKTTMALAPYFALTGKGLDLRENQTTGYAAVDFGDFAICRKIDVSGKSKSTSLTLDGISITEKNLSAEFARRNLHISVLSQLFAENTQLTNEDMLLAAGLKLDVSTILGLVELSDTAKNEIETYFFNTGVNIVTIPIINTAEKFYMEQRKNIKKEIKALEATAAVIPFYGDIPSLKQSLKDAKDNQAVLLEEKGKIKGEIDQINNSRSAKKEFEEQLKNLNDQLEQLEAAIDNESELQNTYNVSCKNRDELICSLNKKEIELDNYNKTLEKERANYSSRKEKITALKASINEKNKIVESLTSTDVCPLYSGLVCNCDKTCVIEEIKKDIGNLISEANSIASDVKVLSENGAALRKRSDTLSDEIKTIRNEKDKAVLNCQTLLNDINNIAGKKNERERIKTQIETLIKANCGYTAPESEDELNKKIADITAEIDSVNKSISELENEFCMAEKKENYTTIISDKTENRKDYDDIITACRQLPEIIFNKLIAPLEATAEETLKTLHPDWKIKFDTSGYVTVAKKSGECIKGSAMSRGEKLLLNYILKVIYAKLININYIILDDVDSLDEIHLEVLIDTVKKSKIPTLMMSANELIRNSGFEEIVL